MSWSNTVECANQNAKSIGFGAYKISHAQLLKVLQDLFKMSFIEMKKFFHYNYSMLIKTKCFPFH